MSGHVTKEAFERMNTDAKLWLMFGQIRELCDEIKTCRGVMEPRISGLEKRKKLDTTVSAGAGIVGGFLAMLAKLAIWRD